MINLIKWPKLGRTRTCNIIAIEQQVHQKHRKDHCPQIMLQVGDCWVEKMCA